MTANYKANIATTSQVFLTTGIVLFYRLVWNDTSFHNSLSLWFGLNVGCVLALVIRERVEAL